MRSDFYSLPWEAQQAIRRGERDRGIANCRARSIAELQARVDELEKLLAEANERLASTPIAPVQDDYCGIVVTNDDPVQDDELR